MLMGEKLIHSQMKVFRELRPGVFVVGVENRYAMLLRRFLFSKVINVHVAQMRGCHERWNRSRGHLGN
jgi:hypothetical protein